MPATLKTKKPKGQARTSEHTENIYPGEHKEPVATKEFVRQELAPVKESVDRLWKVMLWVSGGLLTVMIGGFVLLLTVMTYLHGDTSKRMDRIEDRMDRIEDKMDRIEDKMDKIEDNLKEIKILIQKK